MYEMRDATIKIKSSRLWLVKFYTTWAEEFYFILEWIYMNKKEESSLFFLSQKLLIIITFSFFLFLELL